MAEQIKFQTTSNSIVEHLSAAIPIHSSDLSTKEYGNGAIACLMKDYLTLQQPSSTDLLSCHHVMNRSSGMSSMAKLPSGLSLLLLKSTRIRALKGEVA
jgi:hypothetical protein